MERSDLKAIIVEVLEAHLDGTDCSEIAEDLLEALEEEGVIESDEEDFEEDDDEEDDEDGW